MTINPLTQDAARGSRMSGIVVKRAAVLLLVAAVGAACDDISSGFERDPDDVPLSEIIQLTRTGGDLPLRADGQSADTLLAKIPRDASSRVITFTTSRGSFALAPGSKTIKVRAERSSDPYDRRLTARAVVVSDTTAGDVVASAAVGEYTDYLVIPFVR